MVWQKVPWKMNLNDVNYVFFLVNFLLFWVVDKPLIIFTDYCLSTFFFWVFQEIVLVTFWSIKKDVLREKCPNTEYFLVCIFLHSDWIRRDTKYLSVFSPNARKYGPENTPYLNTFHTVLCSCYVLQILRECL